MLDSIFRFRCQSHVIHKDRNDDFDFSLLVNPDAVVAPDLGESYLLQHLVQLLMPDAW